jgi:hypothetical protein
VDEVCTPGSLFTLITDRSFNTTDLQAMKTPARHANRLFQILQDAGWQIRDAHIYSERDYLHFPYPDAWDSELSDLREILARRRDRFRDSPTEAHLAEDMRDCLVRVHDQAIEAIDRIYSDEANPNP